MWDRNLRYYMEIQISNIVSLFWDTNPMVQLRWTNLTSPLSRFMFIYVLLIWLQCELMFTLICEACALEPSISANYTAVCLLGPMIQQAVNGCTMLNRCFLLPSQQATCSWSGEIHFRWQARLCIVNTRDSRCPDSQGRKKVVSVRRVDDRSSTYHWRRYTYVDHQEAHIT